MTDAPAPTRLTLVTGASRGLGYALALAEARAGAHVLALARTVGGLEELDDAIKAAGGTATLIPLDVTDDGGLARMGAAIAEKWGRLDRWLHCATQAAPCSPANHADAKDVDRAVAVNVRATQRLIRVTDPLLRRSDTGLAVLMDDPRDGQPFFGAYAATKAAARAWWTAWAAETGKTRLRVVLATPPAMPTALRARFFPGEAREALTPCEDGAAQVLAQVGG